MFTYLQFQIQACFMSFGNVPA